MNTSSFRKHFKHGASDSLISFDSWNFSAADACTETSASLSSSSNDEQDFSSCTTAAPMTDDKKGAALSSSETSETNTRQVSVAGVVFSLKASTFAKLHSLPWTWLQEPPNLGGFEGYSLGTSPVLFEFLLNYIMFGNLPKLADMSVADAEELEPLASMLRLHELRCHLDRKIRPHSFGFLRRSSSSRRSDTSKGASPVSLVRKHMVGKSISILRPAASTRHHRKLSLEQLSSISNQLQ